MTFVLSKKSNLLRILLFCMLNLLLQSCSQEKATLNKNISASDKIAVKEASVGWPMNGQDFNGQRFVPLDDINPNNIEQLGFAWEFDDFVVRGRTHRGMESNPILLNEKLYFVGPWNVVYAVDAITGKLYWKYDPNVDGQYARIACCDAVSRGIAISDGKIYTATLDGYLVALSIENGEELWKVDTFYTRKWDTVITGAPYLAGDNILVGNSGADMGSRGYVSAYDANDGTLAWRFWAVPGDPEAGPDETPEVTMARKTWPKDTYWELGLGGNPWDAMAYDPETNTAYLGMGNGSPHPQWARSKSGAEGDNLFLSSIVAVDALTGKMKWYYQTTPGDSWDFTATSPMIFADLKIDGKTRKVIMQAPKNGIFYVLDRITGELLRAAPFTTVNWTDGINMITGRPEFTGHGDYSKSPKIVWPSVAGGHAWHPMAFSPRTGLVYLPVSDAPIRYEMGSKVIFQSGTHIHAHEQFPPFNNPGDDEILKGQPLPKMLGLLKAWDPIKQSVRWTSPQLPFLNGGTLASGDLVFQGASDGYLRVFDATTGKVLREIKIGTSIMAAPISYKIDNVQYLAVMVGAGGPRGAKFAPDEAAATYENYERLIVLKLGGKEIPLPPKRQIKEPPPIPEKIEASDHIMALGQELFELHCQRCHRIGGSIGNYPNLWQMHSGTINAFNAIVGQGALAYAGMGNFSDILSDKEIAAIKAFIINDTILKRQASGKAGAESNAAYH